MAEGVSAGDVAGEISQHHTHSAEPEHEPEGAETVGSPRRHDRVLSIFEAVLLAVVALLAAYTGFASAKWSTESSVRLAAASAARTEANRAALNALDNRNFDSTTFNTWFTAYVAGDTTAEVVAVGVSARPSRWPSTPGWPPIRSPIPKRPPGPPSCASTSSPSWPCRPPWTRRQIRITPAGVQAGTNSDNYVRDTIYLATILFLVGISGHFRFFWIRAGASCSWVRPC